MAAPTKRPWRHDGKDQRKIYVEENPMEVVAEVPTTPRGEADAELICRAVNLHGELVDLCETLLHNTAWDEEWMLSKEEFYALVDQGKLLLEKARQPLRSGRPA